MNYLFVVPVRAFPLTNTTFAMESAFCEHLKVWLDLISPRFTSITVAAVTMPRSQYEASQQHLGVLDAERDRISFVPLYGSHTGGLAFWLRDFLRVCRTLFRLVRSADLVHAGTSHNLGRPVEILALCLAMLRGRKTVSVNDIDLRDDARMNYELGRWSRRNYLMCRYVYDPLRHLQLRFVARRCSLVLFKGEKLRADYGRGRPSVKHLCDPGFSAQNIIGWELLAAKADEVQSGVGPLRLLYFGRLAYYKGVDRCVAAIARVRGAIGDGVRFTIMGMGEEEAALRAQVATLGLQDIVQFAAPIRYGESFFAEVRQHHLMLAAPLSVDTPRSTWDAIASGVPVLGFDTEFYAGLAASTGVVEVVPWPSVDEMAKRIVHHAQHREQLAAMIRRTREIAAANTQEIWLKRRRDWVEELYSTAECSSLDPAQRR